MNYLIIGGGPCADAAAKEIRKGDKEAEIRIITEEWFPPYRRLSLTKQAWDVPFENISLKTKDQNIIIECELKAIDIDPKQKLLTCETNEKQEYHLVDPIYKTYEYDKLLIATGIRPRKLNFKEDIIYLRNYSDFCYLKSQIEGKEHPHVLIIGAGFTGLELGAELAKRGANVTMVYPEDLPCRNILPLDFCVQIVETMRKNKVSMISGETVKEFKYESMGNEFATKREGYNVVLESGRTVTEYFDAVVASVGNIPNIPFEEKLVCDRGIVVNEFLETNIKDVYAAGDVAVFPSKHFGRNMRKEFMDNAIKSGKCAGQNMLGTPTEYDPIINTFFDAFDMSYKAVGEYGMNMDVSYKKVDEGSAMFYREDNVIKGIVFWKVKPALAMATTIIKDKLTLSDDEYLYMMKYK